MATRYEKESGECDRESEAEWAYECEGECGGEGVSVMVRISVSVGDERACVYRCRSLICTGGIGLGIGVCMFQHVMRCHITQCILQWRNKTAVAREKYLHVHGALNGIRDRRLLNIMGVVNG